MHQCARTRAQPFSCCSPRGPVDVKGRPGRVITLRGGIGHARVSRFKSNSANRGHSIRLWRANKGSLARPAYLIRGLDDLYLDGRRCSGLGPRRPCPGACSYIGFYPRCLYNTALEHIGAQPRARPQKYNPRADGMVPVATAPKRATAPVGAAAAAANGDVALSVFRKLRNSRE